MKLILALGLTLATLLGSAHAFAFPAQILIIRHGEKPDTGNDLSPRGYERAQALVGYFESDPQVNQFGHPVAIYAAHPGASDTSMRMIETVTPLAQALNMPLKTNYDKDQIGAMAKEILTNPNYNGKMVLICWEHKMINQLAAILGVNPEPNPWPGDVFDGVWAIDYTSNRVSNFFGLWQHLLPGDH